MKFLLISALLQFPLIAVGSASADPAFIRYYYGEVKYSSPDGKIPYGQTISLVKRTVNPEEYSIVEDVIQPARTPGGAASEFITHIVRTDSASLVFNASDEGKTFSGTLTFSANDWQKNSWIYSIQLCSGGKIEGTGTLSDQGIQTRKTFFNQNEAPTTLIVEDLASISSDRYEEIRKSMKPI